MPGSKQKASLWQSTGRSALARYDVYANADEGGLLLDIQADLLSDLTTCVVVPLVPKSGNIAADRLNPVFNLGGQEWMMWTQYLSAVPKSVLKVRIDNLAGEHDRIIAALDMLFQGF